jgi:hypothetical protein
MLSIVSDHSFAGLTHFFYHINDGRFVIILHSISSKLNFSHFLTCGQNEDIHVFDIETGQIEPLVVLINVIV